MSTAMSSILSHKPRLPFSDCQLNFEAGVFEYRAADRNNKKAFGVGARNSVIEDADPARQGDPNSFRSHMTVVPVL